MFAWNRYTLLFAVPVCWCLLGHFGHLDFLEKRLLDLRYRFRGELFSPVRIAYVDVDNEAIQAYRWPWNHSRYAQLLDALFDHGQVKAVGFDILFSEHSRPEFGLKEQDEGRMMFGKSVHRHQDVVLAANYVPGPGLLQKKRQFPWVFDGATDPDKNDTPELPAYPIIGPTWGKPGLIDTYMGEARFAPAFADSPVGTYYPMALRLALMEWGLTEDALVRFPDRMEVRNPDGTLRTSIPLQRGQLVEANWFSHWISPENPRCSVVDIGKYLGLLEDEDPQNQKLARDFFDQFRGAIVLVGAVDPLLQDLAKTPFDDVPVPQVGFHGNLLKTLLTGHYLRRMPSWSEHMITFLLTVSVVSLAFIKRFDKLRIEVALLPLVALYVAVVFWLFATRHWVLPITAPVGATVMTSMIAAGWQLVDEQRSKSRMKKLFGTYVSPELVEQMVKTGESPRLGGVEEEITAYFSDIQDFTEIAEHLPPDKLVELVNEYLTACTDIILSRNGALDNYIGDAVVAMFGGLIPMKDHAYQACVTSQLVQVRLTELREKWRADGSRWPAIVGRMRTRIGLHSGPAIIGNMGSPRRFNFTMMGDNVNLAARMETGAGSYGILTMVTEATRRDCIRYGGDHVVFRQLDRIIVKGRSEPVSVFEIAGLKEHVTDEMHECIAAYEDGLARYQGMDWDGAERSFLRSLALESHLPGAGLETNPSQVMLSRCRDLRSHPPAADWGGVYVMKNK